VIGRNVDRWLHALSAKRCYGKGEGDIDVGVEESFSQWKTGLLASITQQLGSPAASSTTSGGVKVFKAKASDVKKKRGDKQKESAAAAVTTATSLELPQGLDNASDDDDYEDEEDEEGSAGEDGEGFGSESEEVFDLEDLGAVATKISKAREQREQEDGVGGGDAKLAVGGNPPEPKEMITPMLRKNLTKQGYALIGSHSGVKVCRWTKSMLVRFPRIFVSFAVRLPVFFFVFFSFLSISRGGEAGVTSTASTELRVTGVWRPLPVWRVPTSASFGEFPWPRISLLFFSDVYLPLYSWRHHTNPVGTSWRWKVDDPETLVNGAMENHYRMIKQMKGVPGVVEERYQEAFQIRHCALSLVGEPIMYPHINEFVDLLHQHRISSFLVTNAQFPEKIAQLKPVTQLYVSVDASTKESLKKVDRPLFRDFWDRFVGSLKAIGDKRQRTVYRLTLVKDYNTEELQNYVDLVSLGHPSLIEVKGVTFCGTSGASSLTMSNVPYHEEVVQFCEKMSEMLGREYEIACEHAHSCCILLAHKDFKIDGKWHTWIDYERFHELVASGQPFGSLDYAAPTPEWAVFGHSQRGFDPIDTRHFRKGKKEGEEGEE